MVTGQDNKIFMKNTIIPEIYIIIHSSATPLQNRERNESAAPPHLPPTEINSSQSGSDPNPGSSFT